MVHRDAVDVMGEPKRKERHVQSLLWTAVSGLENGHDLIAQDLPHPLPGKLILSGRHRRVGRIDAAAAHFLDVRVGCKMDSSLAQILFEQTQCEERGVSFIHVISGDPAVAKGGKNLCPADSQERLLTEVIKGIAAVKIVCQLWVRGLFSGKYESSR
jgi:hypothetical protein